MPEELDDNKHENETITESNNESQTSKDKLNNNELLFALGSISSKQ